MARILCRICAYGEFIAGRVAGRIEALFRCRQGVPNAGARTSCPAFMRESGADDEAPPVVRVCGRLPNRYPFLLVAWPAYRNRITFPSP